RLVPPGIHPGWRVVGALRHRRHLVPDQCLRSGSGRRHRRRRPHPAGVPLPVPVGMSFSRSKACEGAAQFVSSTDELGGPPRLCLVDAVEIKTLASALSFLGRLTYQDYAAEIKTLEAA